MSRTQGIERSEIDDLMIMQTALGLLNELNEEDVDWIFRTGFERQVIANTVIVREGEPLAYLTSFLRVCLGSGLLRFPMRRLADWARGRSLAKFHSLKTCSLPQR